MRHTLLLLLLSAGMYAQVSHYSSEVSSTSYTHVNGSVSTASGVNGIQDDIPIGFTFNLGNSNYNTFSISTNGFVRLGYAIVPGTGSRNNSLKNNINQSPLIAPLWDQNNIGTGSIKYKVSGAAPNRMLEVEWHNVNIGSGVLSSVFFASFKIRLIETIDIIEFEYSSDLSAAGVLSASIGLADDVSFLSVTPSDSFTVSAATANNNINSTANLVGKKIRFLPPAACNGVVNVTTVSPSAVNACVGEVPRKIKARVSTSGVSNISYQWQYSVDQVNWTALPDSPGYNSSLLTPMVFEGNDTYYRLKATCLSTGNVSYSQTALVTMAAVPGTQVSNIVFSQQNPNTAKLTWKNGNGYRRVVILSDSPITNYPVSGSGLPGILQNSAYSGSGEQIVFDGTSNKAIITGLNCSTQYYARVFEYQRCGLDGDYNYYFNLNDTANGISFQTEPSPVQQLPIQNDLSLFNGSNLNTTYPGWYETSINTVAGTVPGNQDPQGITSVWRKSDILGIPTACVYLSKNTANAWMVLPRFVAGSQTVMKFKIAPTNNKRSEADPRGISGTYY